MVSVFAIGTNEESKIWTMDQNLFNVLMQQTPNCHSSSSMCNLDSELPTSPTSWGLDYGFFHQRLATALQLQQGGTSHSPGSLPSKHYTHPSQPQPSGHSSHLGEDCEACFQVANLPSFTESHWLELTVLQVARCQPCTSCGKSPHHRGVRACLFEDSPSLLPYQVKSG